MNKNSWIKGALLSALTTLLLGCQTSAVPFSDSGVLLQESAVNLHWNNKWSSSAMLDQQEPADLSPWMSDGVLRMDMQVDSLAGGDLKLRIHYRDGCVRVADITGG